MQAEMKKPQSGQASGLLESNVNLSRKNVMTNDSTAVSNVIPFRFEAKEVRSITIDGVAWFVATDVTACLEYVNSRDAISKHVDCDDRNTVAIRDGKPGNPNQTLINESGLYALIFGSDKAEAKRFKKWVTAEVLPAIRKHGRYEAAPNKMATLVGDVIGSPGEVVLNRVIEQKGYRIAPALQRSYKHTMKSRLRSRFNVQKASLIPADQLEAACNFIAAYALDGEWLPKQESEQHHRLNIHFPVDAITCRRPEMLTLRDSAHAWLDVSLLDLREPFRSPCEAVLCELRRAGYEVEGAWWEFRTYRNKVETLLSAIRGLNRIAEDPQRYAINPNGERA